MDALLPLVVTLLGIGQPCKMDRDLLFMFCQDVSSQYVCKGYEFPKSWYCDGVIAKQCREDMDTLEVFCAANKD
jgi:hypothetical protein